MKLEHGLDLAYCTNIHRGESWHEIFYVLQVHTLAVRDRVARGRPYAIGLRLGKQAARQLHDRGTLLAFQKWLEKENCYIFTINGFPYGQFHGTRVKGQVYTPDWAAPERLEYTMLLFDLLAELVGAGEGSISTVPVSFKEYIREPGQALAAAANLWRCIDHIAGLCQGDGRRLHLGLEPEPLCYLETSAETVDFFDLMQAQRPGDERLREYLGVNYDCCHLAVEFEAAREALRRLRQYQIRISKIHLSSALKVMPTPEARAALKAFADDTYYHQVVARRPDGALVRHRDLDVALGQAVAVAPMEGEEWRVHFHIPLHSPPTPLFGNTQDHILEVFEVLREQPDLCRHFEMETYTWEVMPPELKNRSVVDQLTDEYAWTLARFAEHGFALKR